jgi:hypothetical protein
MKARRPWVTIAPLCLGLLIACGSGSEEFPSSNWTGRYATRIVQSSTDCVDADGPPVMTGFIMDVIQMTTNKTTIKMNPIVELEGEFVGDHVEVSMRVDEPVSLPDSIVARATPADSLNVITYSLAADFDRGDFEGVYVVRSPDLRALINHNRGGRCDFRYQLAGTRFVSITSESEN